MDYGRTLYDSSWNKPTLKWYTVKVRKLMTKHENIVGLISSGSSGALIAGHVLTKKMPRRLVYLHIQKEESSHQGKKTGIDITGAYIFIDDFISTGKTLKRCLLHIKDYKTYQITIPFAVVWFAKESFNGIINITRKYAPKFP